MFSSRWAQKSDEEVMLQVQRGDERALTEMYDRFSKKIVRYFHRMLWKDEARAQDFLHDLFVKIIESPQRFNAERKFSTWIYSVAFNMCKNEYRRENFRHSSQQTMNGNEVRETFQPEMDDTEFQRDLENVLRLADEDDRNLFVLRYELEMPLADIASMMQCPEGTIKSRLFYLKKNLARKLQAYNPAIK